MLIIILKYSRRYCWVVYSVVYIQIQRSKFFEVNGSLVNNLYYIPSFSFRDALATFDLLCSIIFLYQK